LDRQLCTATWTLKLDSFPPADYIELPRPPLATVTSVKYYDLAGTQQTFSSGKYTVDTHSEPGRVVLNYGESWPSIRSQSQAVEVIYTAGYGADDTSVPEALQCALRLLVGHFNENREAVLTGTISKTVELAVDALLQTQNYGRYS